MDTASVHWLPSNKVSIYSKTRLKQHCLVQVRSIADCSHGFKTFVLSIYEWPLKTGFTVASHNLF